MKSVAGVEKVDGSSNSGPDGLSEILSLERALVRLRADERLTGFYRLPFELEFSELAREDWLRPIEIQLKDRAYVPFMGQTLDTPKAKWHIRPVSFLIINDRLVYQYLGLSCLPHLRKHLEWSDGSIRFSNSILPPESDSLVLNPFKGWDEFRERSLGLIRAGYKYALITDIAGYYENIDIARLIRELHDLGVDNTTLHNLSNCLNKWAEPRGRGIPQGCSSSDLFAEFYLDSIDRHLHSEEFIHLRYMDDIRVFAKNKGEARRALHTLTKHLRERGLNLQTAKTDIFEADEAIEKIDKVAQIIRRIGENLANELSQLVASEGCYFGSIESAIQKLATVNPKSPSLDVLNQAWTNFTRGNLDFDKTLFHFLIKRIPGTEGKEYVISTMSERPEETDFCLKYLKRILSLLNETDKDCIAMVLEDANCLYGYQRYKILEWFYENSVKNERVLSYARREIRERSSQILCRAYSYAYVGRFASPQDWETLQGAYIETSDWLERSIVVCSMAGAPRPTRQHFYGRITGEHEIVDRAIRWAKQTTQEE